MTTETTASDKTSDRIILIVAIVVAALGFLAGLAQGSVIDGVFGVIIDFPIAMLIGLAIRWLYRKVAA
jgi:predicted Co/Zn/Cd cation transporter (cation efflux family)